MMPTEFSSQHRCIECPSISALVREKPDRANSAGSCCRWCVRDQRTAGTPRGLPCWVSLVEPAPASPPAPPPVPAFEAPPPFPADRRTFFFFLAAERSVAWSTAETFVKDGERSAIAPGQACAAGTPNASTETAAPIRNRRF